MKLTIPSKSVNEGFARSAVAAFSLELNPSLDEINDIKTAVSEAVTNCIVHAYPNNENGEIIIESTIEDNSIHISVSDYGLGIEDIEKALQPFYSTRSSEERSGMGFTVMQTFMDEVKVFSAPNDGTKIEMCKKISVSEND